MTQYEAIFQVKVKGLRQLNHKIRVWKSFLQKVAFYQVQKKTNSGPLKKNGIADGEHCC